MEVKSHINDTLATAKRWPLNRGIKYNSLLTNKSGLWKVAAVNGGWPPYRWPLNRGRTVLIWSHWNKEIKIHRTIWLQAFIWPQRANITQCSNNLPQRTEILSQRSNLTPQRAENTANDLTRFRHKAGLIHTFGSFLPRPANYSWQCTPDGRIFT